jgi:L-rhamnose isomerase/sugar isomerase
MTARALLVDSEALDKAQKAGDVLAGNDILMDAFYTDVRPALAKWRESKSLDANPLEAFNKSGYLKSIAESRVGGQQAGWGA